MNFTVTVLTDNGREDFDIPVNGVVEIRQAGTKKFFRIKCITRPDLWLESRANIVDNVIGELNHAQVLESDPVRDPNHWLTRPDEAIGKYVTLKAKSQSVRNRRRNVRHGSKAGKRVRKQGS